MARSALATASSVWPEMPFMRGKKGAGQLREWLETQRGIRARTEARRERVLRHDWACKRLCHILQISDAKHWNGYVPPVEDSNGQLNCSPIRGALVELLREVKASESDAG